MILYFYCRPFFVGEQGMVDEAQKALEEAEALKKVAITVTMCNLIYYVIVPANLSRFVFSLAVTDIDELFMASMLFLFFCLANLVFTPINSWRHGRSHLQILLNIQLLMLEL
jgi:hypothetical protein